MWLNFTLWLSFTNFIWFSNAVNWQLPSIGIYNERNKLLICCQYATTMVLIHYFQWIMEAGYWFFFCSWSKVKYAACTLPYRWYYTTSNWFNCQWTKVKYATVMLPFQCLYATYFNLLTFFRHSFPFRHRYFLTASTSNLSSHPNSSASGS